MRVGTSGPSSAGMVRAAGRRDGSRVAEGSVRWRSPCCHVAAVRWTTGSGPIVRVRLSHANFALLISTPARIRWVGRG